MRVQVRSGQTSRLGDVRESPIALVAIQDAGASLDLHRRLAEAPATVKEQIEITVAIVVEHGPAAADLFEHRVQGGLVPVTEGELDAGAGREILKPVLGTSLAHDRRPWLLGR